MSEVAVKVMKSANFEEVGGPEVLKIMECPIPEIGADEVLIKVHAAGINRPDVIQRKGFYPPPPGASDIPGLEISGVVMTCGVKVAEPLTGQKVCALVGGGGYAEYCVAKAAHCLPVSGALTLDEAAAMPETLFTVWHNVFQRGFARDGEKLLVHGGTSGIGTMAIKLANLFDIEAIVTCGSDEKCAMAEKLGASLAINYKDGDFVEAVKAHTDGVGVNIILDMVGGDYVPRNIACLAEEGRHVSIAFQKGVAAQINIVDIMRRRLTLTGSTLRARHDGFKALLADEISREIWPDTESGALKPEIYKSYALDEAAQAHQDMEDGKILGKAILKIADLD